MAVRLCTTSLLVLLLGVTIQTCAALDKNNNLFRRNVTHVTLPVVSRSNVSSPATQSETDVPCEKLVPGLDRMAQGIDISVLDLFPPDVTSPGGFMRSALSYTCNTKRAWHDPQNPSEVYDIPDQVDAIISVPAGSLNIKTRYNEKMQQYKDSMAVKVGLSMDAGLFGSFSASAGYKETQEKLLKTEKSVSETTAAESAFEVHFQPSVKVKLNENFRELVDSLPAKYADNPSGYDSLIDRYGTHYFDKAKFGGFMYEKTVIDNQYMEQTSEREINLNLQASFKMFVKVDASMEMDQISSESRSEFQKNSETSFYFYGGMTKLTNDTSAGAKYEEWRQSVTQNPWLFGGQVAPIQNLIADSAKKVATQTAVFVRLAKRYLGDVRGAFDLSGVAMSSTVRDKLQQVETALANPSISTAELEDLNRQIAAIFADLQKAIDEAQQNKLDFGDRYESFIRANREDTSCPCKTMGGSGGSSNDNLEQCLKSTSQINFADCKNYQVYSMDVFYQCILRPGSCKIFMSK